MFLRHLYLQLCAIFVTSLLVFAAIAYFIVDVSGHDRYEDLLFQKTSSLTELLLPEAGADLAQQKKAVDDISSALNFDITLWSADNQLIAATGKPTELNPSDIGSVQWNDNAAGKRFMKMLADGRSIVVDVNQADIPSDTFGIGFSLLVLAGLISLAVYPFIRRVTRRLERLQRGVERIGSGNLNARVLVEGSDEVAGVARSFNKAAEQIEKLVTSQRLLLANASHELRTPLARIRMGIEMLQKKDNPERRVAMQDDIKEVDALIDELILISRIDTGLATQKFENVHLMAIAAEECARYQNCSVSGDAAEINGDPRLIQHLMRNLLDNAVVHGLAPVEVIIHANKSAVELAVMDAGEGISEGERQNVLQPFYRGKNKQNVPGSGLGLPLVQKIAHAHGGTIMIDNATISTVRVLFPNPHIATEGEFDHVS
ncbi:sensor histidine kinase [Parasphingorhabdus cellanae]|uniref:histidine kinase n=1 Tax=Parasphingorhabdus cellanae TaxID=2806553 RepID=A0ABX7T6W0_9SPHN|nr:HAMP domain-containing sensor histidine kinase [Parasphingorhabdus cellanae]QTD57340.1 HAMP domain-containing histidine kinase [Parasphingorhabdus cellanae]